MKQAIATVLLLCGGSFVAQADVWRWVDARGNTHYVDTMKPIYTWVDDYDKVHYSDTPDHEDAVAVQLVWHSSGSLDDVQAAADASGDSGELYPGETPEQRAEREAAEQYYCKRATEVYESYLNAPQLYMTNDAGERVFLTEQEADRTIADTKARVDRYCR